jgi:hypothetical protein
VRNSVPENTENWPRTTPDLRIQGDLNRLRNRIGRARRARAAQFLRCPLRPCCFGRCTVDLDLEMRDPSRKPRRRPHVIQSSRNRSRLVTPAPGATSSPAGDVVQVQESIRIGWPETTLAGPRRRWQPAGRRSARTPAPPLRGISPAFLCPNAYLLKACPMCKRH